MLGLELGLIGLIGLGLTIYAMIHVLGSRSSTLTKALWAVGLLVFPLVGFVAWLVAGPRSRR